MFIHQLITLASVTVVTWSTQAATGRATSAKMTPSPRCDLGHVIERCEHYVMLSRPDFHAFIPPDTLDETCSTMQTGLECVYKHLAGCGERAAIPFDIQRSVIRVICKDSRQEYLDGKRCFSSSRVKDHIHSCCMTPLADIKLLQTEPCRLIRQVPACAVEAVRMDDACSSAEAELMAVLVDAYLKPSVGILCDAWKENHLTSTEPSTTTTAYSIDINMTAGKADTSLHSHSDGDIAVFGDKTAGRETTQNSTHQRQNLTDRPHQSAQNQNSSNRKAHKSGQKQKIENSAAVVHQHFAKICLAVLTYFIVASNFI